MILVAGGCRSGKSDYARRFAEGIPGRRVFLATATAVDEEMRQRIRNHREAREPAGWKTVEEPLALAGALDAAGPDLAGSVPFFPFVGILLGAVAAASSWAVSLAAPPLPAGAAVVILLVAFSGGMHMDGLSDTADGFLSAQPGEKVLEIMKDSRAGPMGVTAVVCVLLFKFATVGSLTGMRFPRAVFLMPLAGRCALVVHTALLPYLRRNGLGTIFQGNWPRLSAVWAAAVMALAGWAALGLAGLATAGLCLAASLAFAWWCHRRIGGATGDTCGAACEIAEAVPAAVLAVWPG